MGKRRILNEEEKAKIEKSKQELKDYREDIKYIEEKLDDAKELKTTIEKVTSVLALSRTSGGNIDNDKFADGISRLEELKIDCSERLKTLILKKFIIDDKIEQIEQPYRNVLFFRYTRGKSWEETAKELGYTRDYVCELHGEALYKYSKI